MQESTVILNRFPHIILSNIKNLRETQLGA